MKSNTIKLVKKKTGSVYFSLLFISFCFMYFSCTLCAAESDEKMLSQYIRSRGLSIILFDASNIKQFWIENTVISRDNSFSILLNRTNSQTFESVPLKIQLANVNETQDCKVEIISETKDLSFSVQNNESKTISSSKKEEDFLSYTVTSSIFHLEDAPKMFFELKFGSKGIDILSIKKIILSFSNNKETSFLVPSGKIKFTPKNTKTSSNPAHSATIKEVNPDSFAVTGTRSIIFSTKKIFTQDNTLSCSMTIKNIGENETQLYIGYAVYTQDNVMLDATSYPAKPSCEVLSVVSALEGNDKITVDAYSDWFKGSFLALDAKDDLSDIPSNTFVKGTITEIKKLENGQAEITLNRPLQTKVKEGTKVRVHGQSGAYLYTIVKGLHPGEERVFSSTIKKDNNFLEYSSKAFPKGAYYVVPVILSYSLDANKENTILISDYTVSY